MFNPKPLAPHGSVVVYGDPEEYFQQHNSEGKQHVAKSLVREIILSTGLEHPAILDIGSGRGEVVWAKGELLARRCA